MSTETIAERLRQMQPGSARTTLFAGDFQQRAMPNMERRARAAQAAGEALQRVLPTLAKAASMSPAYSFGVVAHLTADSPDDPAVKHVTASLTAPAAALEVLYVLRGRVIDAQGTRRGYLDFGETRRIGEAGWQLCISDPWAYGWFGSKEPVDSWIWDLLVLAKWFQSTPL